VLDREGSALVGELLGANAMLALPLMLVHVSLHMCTDCESQEMKYGGALGTFFEFEEDGTHHSHFQFNCFISPAPACFSMFQWQLGICSRKAGSA